MAGKSFTRLFESPYVWFGMAVLVWLPLNLYSLMSYPAPNADDAWFGSVAVQFLQTGTFQSPILGVDVHDGTSWRLYSMGLAQAFRLFGIGLLQARLFSVAAALAGAWMLFVFGRTLYGAVEGLVAAALYLFSLWVLAASHTVRPDLWVNAAGAAAFWGFWQVRTSRRPWPAFLLGLFAAAAVDIYIVVVYSSLAVSAAMIVEFRRRADRKLLGLYVVGGLLGTLYWFLVRLLPDPGSSVSQWQYLTHFYVQPVSADFSLWAYLSSMAAAARVGLIGNSRLGPLEMTYVLAGSLILLRRRQTPDRLVLFGLFVQWMGIFLPYKGLNHFLDLIPFFSLASAVGIVSAAKWLTPRLPRVRPAVLAAGLSLPLMAGYVAASLVLGWRSRVIEYGRYANQIRALVPQGASVLGESTWWWVLRDGPFTYDYYISLLSYKREDLSLPEVVDLVLKQREINAILLDERLGYWPLTGEPLPERESSIAEALMDYAETQCRLEGVVEGYGYGAELGGPAIKRTRVFLCSEHE